MSGRIRMGMVGGGQGAFIGGVHRIAATMDDRIELVCGAFSSSPTRSRESGRALHLPDRRVYTSYGEMFLREAQLPPEERMEFVSIVTPNHLHAPVATAALRAGFHVACDKPLAYDLAEARRLARLVEKSGREFLLTHNYAGYPLVRQAREMVAKGALGRLRKIVVEYPQGWLAQPIEKEKQKQASWRTDPKRAGASCCIGDIGTHAAHLAEYITGLKIREVCADLSTSVRGRKLDDDGVALLRFDKDVKGSLWASQVAIDEENGLAIRIYGDKGGLRWRQEEPNTLVLMHGDRPREILRTGANYGDRLAPSAVAACRLPAGHPEGYLEGFANLYRDFADRLEKHRRGRPPRKAPEYPGIREGLRGMAFIEACVKSSKNGQKWTRLASV